MPNRLHRYYGAGYSHFITTSCYQRLPLLASPRNRDLFLDVLERVRRRYRFVVVGYVVMPEHVHLLIGEPQRGSPSTVTQALKQGFARRLLSRMQARSNPPQLKLWGDPVEKGQIEATNYLLFNWAGQLTTSVSDSVEGCSVWTETRNRLPSAVTS